MLTVVRAITLQTVVFSLQNRDGLAVVPHSFRNS